MQLFYHPLVQETDKEIIFPKDESRHIVKVLRKAEGDALLLTNGEGFVFHAEITAASAKGCIAKILKVEKELPAPYHLHMAVAPTKMNDRFEWFLEKATEIGIHEITPVICEHSERRNVKMERFERVVQSAMKQSLHTRIPKLNDAIAFSEFIDQDFDGLCFIAHCEDEKERHSLKQLVEAKQKITILIGPEGDFSTNEIEACLAKNWQPVSLGNSRLRTETAAIVACHTVALANEE